MLNITNIDKLSGFMLGNWETVDSEARRPASYLSAHHYCITFSRGNVFGAVLIDREMNPLLKQYHIYICYENFDRVISETSWSFDANGHDRVEFFEMVMKNLDYEWNKRNIRS